MSGRKSLIGVKGCDDCPFSGGQFCRVAEPGAHDPMNRRAMRHDGVDHPDWCPLATGGPITVATTLRIEKTRGGS